MLQNRFVTAPRLNAVVRSEQQRSRHDFKPSDSRILSGRFLDYFEQSTSQLFFFFAFGHSVTFPEAAAVAVPT